MSHLTRQCLAWALIVCLLPTPAMRLAASEQLQVATQRPQRMFLVTVKLPVPAAPGLQTPIVPTDPNNTVWIQNLYQEFLNRPPYFPVVEWQVDPTPDSRQQIASQLQAADRSFIDRFYQQYLNRPPDDPANGMRAAYGTLLVTPLERPATFPGNEPILLAEGPGGGPIPGGAQVPPGAMVSGGPGPQEPAQAAAPDPELDRAGRDYARGIFGDQVQGWNATADPTDGSVRIRAPDGRRDVVVRPETLPNGTRRVNITTTEVITGPSVGIDGREYVDVRVRGNVAGTDLDFKSQVPYEAPPQGLATNTSAPPAAPPPPAQQNRTLTPQEIQARVDQAMKLAYDKLMVRARDVRGSRIVNGAPLAEYTIATLVLIRDIYARSLSFFINKMKEFQKLSRAEKLQQIQQALPLVSRAQFWWNVIEKSRGRSTDFFWFVQDEIKKAEQKGDKTTANLLRSALRAPLGPRWSMLREQFFAALDGHPLAGLLYNEISGPVTANASDYLGAYDTAVAAAIAKANTEIDRVKRIDTVEGYQEFFGSQYARAWGVAAGALGKYSRDMLGLFPQAAAAFRELDASLKEERDLVFQLVVLGTGVVAFALAPVTLIGAAGVGLLAGGGQLAYDGYNYYVVSGQLDSVQAGGGVLGAQAVQELKDKAEDARNTALLDAPFVVLDAVAFGLAIKEARALQAAARTRQAAQAIEAGLANAIPDGRPPVIRDVTDPQSILKRVEVSYTNPRALGDPPNGDFFADARLAPKKTIEVGGQTYHISAPFRGPSNRAAVIAFQETADGKVIPRTWYLSNEHGKWRVAAGYGTNPFADGALLNKGPMQYVEVDRNGNIVREVTFEEAMELKSRAKQVFVNEAGVDLTTELDGALAQWVNEQGFISLGDDAAERAFFGHLQNTYGAEASEFNANLSFGRRARTAVEMPLPGNGLTGGVRPKLDTGPIRSWEFDSPLYGRVEGFVYRSEDGTTLYTVLRDRRGRVWVPGVQDAQVPLTPFGTRIEAYRTDFTTTPIRHAKPGDVQAALEGRVRFIDRNGRPVTVRPGDPNAPKFPDRQPQFIDEKGAPIKRPEYVDAGDEYVNPLNELFRDSLPPPGAVPTSPATIAATPAGAVTAPRAAAAGGTTPASPGAQTVRAAGIARAGNSIGGLTTPQGGAEPGRAAAPRRSSTEELEKLGRALAEQMERDERASPPRVEAPKTGAMAAPPPLPKGAAFAAMPENFKATWADAFAREAVDAARIDNATASQLADRFARPLEDLAISTEEFIRATAREQARRDRLDPPRSTANPLTRTLQLASLFSNAGGASAPGVQANLTSLGSSAGDAFRLDVTNGGATPVEIAGEGIVVEPVLDAPGFNALAATAERQSNASADVEGYCLEWQQPPPEEGMRYRVAAPDVQARFRPFVKVVQTAQRLADAGRLTPDSTPKVYFEFVKQYALWTKLENWNLAKFREVFVDRTRQNVVNQGKVWSKEFEKTVEAAVPGRWRDITMVLAEAAR